MKKYIENLSHTTLFDGIETHEAEVMIDCLGMTIREFKKGEYVYHSGELVREVSVLIAGRLMIQRDDYWGNRSVMSTIGAGEVFGEAYATQDQEAILNDVIAVDDCVILFFDIGRLLTPCSNACQFHTRMIANLIRSMSAKNRMLAHKIDCMAKRSTREKLIAYLSAQSKRAGRANFEIPFNRQQLADYLAVDRSAMSKELCKMRDEGMLEFDRSRFTLL